MLRPQAGGPKEEARCDPQNKLWWDRADESRRSSTHAEGRRSRRCLASSRLSDGTPVKPAFQLLEERVETYTPEWAAGHHRHSRRKRSAGSRTRWASRRATQKIELPIAWTDSWGKEHDTVTGNPVAFHAMRGLAAHSNGFHTIRALAILMSLLGTIDRPGGFRHKAPFPRADPARALSPPKAPHAVKPDTPLDGRAARLARRARTTCSSTTTASPCASTRRFSWEYPLSAHGLMHNVITNAWRGDPYPIDTLMIFMANMAWNSTMNTSEVRRMLNDKREDGRIQDPVPRRLRRVPVGDDRVRRPRAARHDLSRAARRACRCSTGRSRSSTARPTRCAFRCCRRRASASRSRRC